MSDFLERVISPDLAGEVRAAQGSLSPVNLKFLEYVLEDPGRTGKIHYAGCDMPEWMLPYCYPTQSWPTFLDPDRAQELAGCAEQVTALIKAIPERRYAGDADGFARYFSLPSRDLADLMLGSPTGLAGAFCRCDFIDTADGPKLLEINFSACLGGWQVQFEEHWCREDAVIAGFLEREGLAPVHRNPIRACFDHVAEELLEHFGPSPAELTAVLLLPPTSAGTGRQSEPFFSKLFQDAVSARSPGTATRFLQCGDGRQLEVGRGGLTLAGSRVHAVIEFRDEFSPPKVFRALKSGAALVYNGPLARILGSKLSVACLSEEEDSPFWTEEERRFLRQVVPWSRRVLPVETVFRGEAVYLPELLERCRPDLVLKAAAGARGESVVVGRCTPQEAWEQKVAQALSEGWWVVQEYLPGRAHLFQHGDRGFAVHDAVWGLFRFGPAYGGGFLRVLPRGAGRGVINAAQGASFGIVYEL